MLLSEVINTNNYCNNKFSNKCLLIRDTKVQIIYNIKFTTALTLEYIKNFKICVFKILKYHVTNNLDSMVNKVSSEWNDTRINLCHLGLKTRFKARGVKRNSCSKKVCVEFTKFNIQSLPYVFNLL